MSHLRIFLIVSLLLVLSQLLFAQHLQPVTTNIKASLRGLSVVSKKMIWVSGSEGTVGKSTDGGTTWTWMKVPGYEQRDFRDIEAFDKSTAIIMAVDTPAIILRTANAGKDWQLVYENHNAGMFLDAMEFWNRESGIVVGDPVNGKFFVARTFDNGKSWKDIPSKTTPEAMQGEACFAASGTNVRALDRDEACFVSGGSTSRLFWKGQPVDLQIQHGKESQGANSVTVWNKGYIAPHLIIVGGDFAADSCRIKNCTISRDGGKTWIRPSNPPYGYRSCVEFISAQKLITCGTNGVDISLDEGINWNAVSTDGYNVCRKAKKGDAVFLAGSQGKIAKLVW